MKFKKFGFPIRSSLAIALCAAFSAPALAAAGTAQFTAGDVQLKRADGGLAPLAKGKIIDSGQAIVTGVDGRAQVRFTDGGLISLQPNTEFKIASYVDKLDAKEDRFLVDLLRGSMRAITGLIGKRNRDNYKVNTATATIGIRGSGFNVGYNPDGTLSVTTELDAIEVCTAGGCIGLTAGESVKVLSNSQAPVRTNVRTVVPTPPPAQEALIAAQQGAALAQIKAPPVVVPVPESPNNLEIVNAALVSQAENPNTISVNGVLPFDPIDKPTGGVLNTFDANGQLLSIKDLSLPLATTSANLPGDSYSKLGSPADADFLSWGNWTRAIQTDSQTGGITEYNSFSWVTGRPTLGSTAAPSAGVATYAANSDIGGGTVPVFRPEGGGVVFGTFNSASLTVNFATNVVSASVSTSLGGFINVGGNMTSERAFTNAQAGSITYSGFLVGPSANRAGFTYSIPGFVGEVNGLTTGAVGLVRTTLTP